MRLLFAILILVVGCSVVSSCRSYSKYAIDKRPRVAIDSGLLGIWKTAADTQKGNYILIQSAYDNFRPSEAWHSMTAEEKRLSCVVARQQIWAGYEARYPPALAKRFEVNDTATYNDAYWVKWRDDHYDEARRDFLNDSNRHYFFTYYDHNGTNPRYNLWRGFLSVVKGEHFLNLDYGNGDERGFLLMRLLRLNKTKDTVAIAMVADTTLRYLADETSVRRRIEENLSVQSFYADTLIFYKVSNYHQDAEGSAKEAKRY
jgi:hypothetical protein